MVYLAGGWILSHSLVYATIKQTEHTSCAQYGVCEGKEECVYMCKDDILVTICNTLSL